MIHKLMGTTRYNNNNKIKCMQNWAFHFSKDPTFCLTMFLLNMVPFRFTKNFQLVFYKLKRSHRFKVLEIQKFGKIRNNLIYVKIVHVLW
jgi:hypothetical protein